MNKAEFIGNLTRQPELFSTESGKDICKFDIAVADNFGEKRNTYFFHIVVWGKQGENCAKFLDKGSKVYVCGRLTNREYTKKDGTKTTITELIANEVEFLSPKAKEEVKQVIMEEINYDKDLPF